MSKLCKEKEEFIKEENCYYDEENKITFKFMENCYFNLWPKSFSSLDIIGEKNDSKIKVSELVQYLGISEISKINIHLINDTIDLSYFSGLKFKNLIIREGKIKNYCNKIFLDLFNVHFIQNFEHCLINNIEINVICYKFIGSNSASYKYITSRNRIPTNLPEICGYHNNEDEIVLAFLVKKARSYGREFNYYFCTSRVFCRIDDFIFGKISSHNSNKITNEMVDSYSKNIESDIKKFFRVNGVIYEEESNDVRTLEDLSNDFGLFE